MLCACSVGLKFETLCSCFEISTFVSLNLCLCVSSCVSSTNSNNTLPQNPLQLEFRQSLLDQRWNSATGLVQREPTRNMCCPKKSCTSGRISSHRVPTLLLTHQPEELVLTHAEIVASQLENVKAETESKTAMQSWGILSGECRQLVSFHLDLLALSLLGRQVEASIFCCR